jgi:hypothetical protein
MNHSTILARGAIAAALLLTPLARLGFAQEPTPVQPRSAMTARDDLENGFLNPPDSAKPQTWWHWADGNISKEGIVAELQAMKRIGLGGATMFTVMGYPPKPNSKVLCLSPEWHELVRVALRECDRLNLALTVQVCAGWSTAGGPWITPDKGMQHVVFSKHTVGGGQTLKLAAPPSWPQRGDTYYRDIAVLAFPTPAACIGDLVLPAPKVTSSFAGLDTSRLREGVEEVKKVIEIPAGRSGWVQFEFPASVTCRSLLIAGAKEERSPDEHRAVVVASDDGREFHEVCRLSTYLSNDAAVGVGVVHAIPQTKAKFFRLAWKGPVKLKLRQIAWSAEPAIYSYDSKIAEVGRTLIAEPVLPTEDGIAVPLDKIVDLTSRLDAQGDLAWTAPAGTWTVTRIGYRNTGKVNEPAPPEATGLECDKFSREAAIFHFNNYVGTILKDAAAVGGKGMRGVLNDSWEARRQNWSPVFRDEFRRRRGYDPAAYMPAFAGFIVGDRDITDRFLCDIRQTCSDLVSENYYGTILEQAHKHGLYYYAESCGGSGAGTMVADGLQHYLHVDFPMTEFGRPLKEACSAGHVANKKAVALEAFTEGQGANWEDCPAGLKPDCDASLCVGINRIIFHTYAHNPDVARVYPGPAFWNYGMPFSRGQTWWEMGRAFITYLSRCQFLLQRGKAAADVLYFYGEEPAGPIPGVFTGTWGNFGCDQWPALPKGFDFDLLPAEILIKSLSAKDGKLTLPDGTTYRLLVLRDSDRMTPEAAAKIKELVQAGATVMGPKPRRSPSLTGYPQCDQLVRQIGDEVWGDCDGKTVAQHAFGKGRVFCGTTLKETLAAMPLAPDFSAGGATADADLRFIHRRDGEAEIYFVANHAQQTADITAGFRVSGKQPEIWDPIAGKLHDAYSYRQESGRTYVPLHFERFESVVVVFRRPAAAVAASRPAPTFREALRLNGPWKVAFTPGWGAPESVVFDSLDDWSKRPEDGIKYYSGTAVYKTALDWNGPVPDAVCLDLGEVAVIAGVRLNGTDCGIAWTSPYRVDIAKALKPGHNELEVRVANTWANRLIGEGRVAGATLHAWTTYHRYTKDSPPVRSGLLGPVTIQVVEPDRAK